MKTIFLVVLLIIPAAAVAKKEQSAAKNQVSADETTLKLARVVLDTPTAELDPTLAGAFLKVDAETLPIRLRTKARGKQLELRSLIAIAEGKKKGGIRVVGPEGCTPEEFKAADIPMLLAVGFVEAYETGIDGAQQQTQCTELDMQCQFTLKIVDTPGSKRPRRYFFQERDPMLAIVQLKEQGAKAGQTNFFGSTFLTCQH